MVKIDKGLNVSEWKQTSRNKFAGLLDIFRKKTKYKNVSDPLNTPLLLKAQLRVRS